MRKDSKCWTRMKKLGKDGSATAIWLEWNLVLPASKGCLNISSTVCLVQKADSALEAEGTSVFFFKKKKTNHKGSSLTLTVLLRIT